MVIIKSKIGIKGGGINIMYGEFVYYGRYTERIERFGESLERSYQSITMIENQLKELENKLSERQVLREFRQRFIKRRIRPRGYFKIILSKLLYHAERMSLPQFKEYISGVKIEIMLIKTVDINFFSDWIVTNVSATGKAALIAKEIHNLHSRIEKIINTLEFKKKLGDDHYIDFYELSKRIPRTVFFKDLTSRIIMIIKNLASGKKSYDQVIEELEDMKYLCEETLLRTL